MKAHYVLFCNNKFDSQLIIKLIGNIKMGNVTIERKLKMLMLIEQHETPT